MTQPARNAMQEALTILDSAAREPGGIEGLNFDQRIAMAQVWATLANAEAIKAIANAIREVDSPRDR
jgi:hypothetical protein